MKNLLLTFILLTLGVPAMLLANTAPNGGAPGTNEVSMAPASLPSTVNILNPDTIRICAGDTIFLEQTNDCNDENLQWTTRFDGAGFIDPTDQPSVRATPTFSQFYIVSTGPDGGPFASDSVFVDVDNLVIPTIVGDTTICQGSPLQLVPNPVDPQQTLYTWSPGIDYLRDSTDVNSIFTPSNDIDTVFTLISFVANGACADTQQVNVSIIRSELNILSEDTIFRCLGDEALVLEVSVDPFVDSGDVTWRPSTGGLTAPAGSTYTVDPVGNVVYYAEGVINGCPQIDSVAVRVDSLPVDMSFTVDPVKDPYCQGDTFTIQSPTYDVGDYPLISHEWLVAPGIASPQDLYNAVVFASDSALFSRVNLNGGCADTTTVQINVISPPILIFDPATPMVCPGEPVQINVSFDPSGPAGTLEWEDPVGGTLSCDDCLDPVATVPAGGVTYMITVTAEGSQCTSPASYTIQTISDIEPILNDGSPSCPGGARRIITGNIIPTYTYQITGGGIDSNDPLTEVSPTMTTTYTVTTTGDCETFTESVTLEVVEDYTLSVAGPDVVCAGNEVQLTANPSANRNGTFTWVFPDGSTSNERTINVTPVDGDVYNVTFQDNFGCSSATASYTASVVGGDFTVDVIATSLDSEILESAFAGQTVLLNAVGVPAGLEVTYSWSGNFNPSSGDGNPFEVTIPGSDDRPGALDYTVTVTTVDGACEQSVRFTLPVITSDVQIPEVFTPNGDGTNDGFRVFYPPASQVDDFTLSIFNRWGQKIFTSTDIDEAWDGTKNGTPQNMDTYLYVTSFRLNGELFERDGQFSLIR